MDLMNMKIVCWENLITGFADCGNPVDEDVADVWVDYLNAKYPEIFHWSAIYYKAVD